MITLIDYGLGNIRAFTNVYKRWGIPIAIARCKDDLSGASKLILPGVGAFDYAMQQFNETGLREEVSRLVFEQCVPLLGICVGMQMLACSSDEGVLPGLGWIRGHVKRIVAGQNSYPIFLPHMGWNDVMFVNQSPLFFGIERGARFYFLHSYFFQCQDSDDVLAESEYGQRFACAVNQNHIYGVQFHPEKSHHYGAQLLKNFAEL